MVWYVCNVKTQQTQDEAQRRMQLQLVWLKREASAIKDFSSFYLLSISSCFDLAHPYSLVYNIFLCYFRNLQS